MPITFAFPDPDNALLPSDLADILVGSPGNEGIIHGGFGDDSIFGLEGDDLLVGGHGDDYVFGGPGRDIIFGNLDFDFLSGGPGNDFLIGGREADTLEGGSGADYFIFRNQEDGEDRILDFEFGMDKIVVPDFVPSRGGDGTPPPGERYEVAIFGPPAVSGNLPLQSADRPPNPDNPELEDLKIAYATGSYPARVILVGVSPDVYLTAINDPATLFIHVSDLPPDVLLDISLFG
jgi:RTX calcium-binding nonapeptide repeat (4 copies)